MMRIARLILFVAVAAPPCGLPLFAQTKISTPARKNKNPEAMGTGAGGVEIKEGRKGVFDGASLSVRLLNKRAG